MKERENILLLLFGPTVHMVGIDMLPKEFLSALVFIVCGAFLTIIGSYYQWIYPKNRSKLWLILPGLITAFAYFPLILLPEDTSGTLAERFKRIFPDGKRQ
ncbi:hypothetical protein ACFLXF_00380 [Chloroflexota bacterium]